MFPIYFGYSSNIFIDYKIPLSEWKEATSTIDFKSDKLIMFHRLVNLIHTTSSHYGKLLSNDQEIVRNTDNNIIYF